MYVYTLCQYILLVYEYVHDYRHKNTLNDFPKNLIKYLHSHCNFVPIYLTAIPEFKAKRFGVGVAANSSGALNQSWTVDTEKDMCRQVVESLVLGTDTPPTKLTYLQEHTYGSIHHRHLEIATGSARNSSSVANFDSVTPVYLIVGSRESFEIAVP